MSETGKELRPSETVETFSLRRRADSPQNVALAQAIRAVDAMYEGSWVNTRYTKRYSECIQAVVGDDPIGIILYCLFTAGYCEMFDFADKVLGPAEPKPGED